MDGAKSVLDLPRTVEALEALGVPVYGVGTDRSRLGILLAGSTPPGRPPLETVLPANLGQGDRSMLESAGA
jgi:hypothetical protein